MRKGRASRKLRKRYGYSRLTSTLDEGLESLHRASSKVEAAHELAPTGPAKAIIAGLYTDLSNGMATFRTATRQIKKLE